jgi:D-alanyl-D-alanine dipeptidase
MSKGALLESVKADTLKRLVVLKTLIPGLLIDMPYATAKNFTGTVLYHNPVAYLRYAPAHALKQVQDELKKKGLALKIYDAFRPFGITCKIWHTNADRHYVANPAKGSNHNRGLALDLTLIDVKTGRELNMGTAFDNFTDTAHHGFPFLSAQVIANRKLLKSTMRKYGFGHVPAEWWHYQWRNDRDYEVLDLDFTDLR